MIGGWRGQIPGNELCWGYFPAPKGPSRRWQLQREVSPTPAHSRAHGLVCYLQVAPHRPPPSPRGDWVITFANHAFAGEEMGSKRLEWAKSRSVRTTPRSSSFPRDYPSEPARTETCSHAHLGQSPSAPTAGHPSLLPSRAMGWAWLGKQGAGAYQSTSQSTSQ